MFKFQIFIHIFTIVKLKNNTKILKAGEKGVFLSLFQSNVSQWINKVQAPYLFQTVADYLVYHMYKNIAIIQIFN